MLLPSDTSMLRGVSAPIRVIPPGASSWPCMIRFDSSSPIPGISTSANVLRVSSPPKTDW